MNHEVNIIVSNDIQHRIFTIRDLQVMLDRDLAELYGVENKRLNEQVKRNIERFPEQFRFQLTQEEFERLKSQIVTPTNDSLRSQIATLETGRGKHRKYLPYVFTEQGVSMLSAVLRSETAIKVSIQIMDAFVGMRKFIANNAAIFQRLDNIEQKQHLTDTKLDQVFEAIEAKEIKPEQGIFFDGQVFDDNDIYHFGASLKDLGKKWFAFSKMDKSALVMLGKLSHE